MADIDGAPERPLMEIHHQHGDVTGGWLRPAVFGMMDGLVSNFALISGVAGGGAASTTIVLTGLAGLVAGACSMATGEYTSVASQSEHVRKEIEIERAEIARNPAGEERELVALYRHKGLSRVWRLRSRTSSPRTPTSCGGCTSARKWASTQTTCPRPGWPLDRRSLAFSVGAIVPVLPYIFGASTLTIALVLSLLALFVSGAVVARLTSVSPWFGGARQMLLGALAAAVTFGAGSLVGAALG